MKNIYFALLACVLLTGCSSVKVVKYPKLPDDVYANYSLLEYFRTNPKPKIVLRVPGPGQPATSNSLSGQTSNLLYNTIEKELLKEGFSVRDRKLFDAIVVKTEPTDYAKISEETNTDLILEVTNIDAEVLYSTNKVSVTTNKISRDEIEPTDFDKFGMSVEFRLILIKNNEIAGNYKYYYNPCAENGCPLSDWSNAKRTKPSTKQTVPINNLEEFVTKCTQDLVNSFKS